MKCCNLSEELTLVQQDCTPTFREKLIMGGFTADRDCNIHVNIIRSLQWTWIKPPGLKQAIKITKEIPLPIPELPGILTGIFRNFLKSGIYFDWSWQSTQMKNVSEERSVSVKITRDQKTQLWQSVGQCGWLTLSADCISQSNETGLYYYITQTDCYGSGKASIYFGFEKHAGIFKIICVGLILTVLI